MDHYQTDKSKEEKTTSRSSHSHQPNSSSASSSSGSSSGSSSSSAFIVSLLEQQTSIEDDEQLGYPLILEQPKKASTLDEDLELAKERSIRELPMDEYEDRAVTEAINNDRLFTAVENSKQNLNKKGKRKASGKNEEISEDEKNPSLVNEDHLNLDGQDNKRSIIEANEDLLEPVSKIEILPVSLARLAISGHVDPQLEKTITNLMKIVRFVLKSQKINWSKFVTPMLSIYNNFEMIVTQNIPEDKQSLAREVFSLLKEQTGSFGISKLDHSTLTQIFSTMSDETNRVSLAEIAFLFLTVMQVLQNKGSSRKDFIEAIPGSEKLLNLFDRLSIELIEYQFRDNISSYQSDENFQNFREKLVNIMGMRHYFYVAFGGVTEAQKGDTAKKIIDILLENLILKKESEITKNCGYEAHANLALLKDKDKRDVLSHIISTMNSLADNIVHAWESKQTLQVNNKIINKSIYHFAKDIQNSRSFKVNNFTATLGVGFAKENGQTTIYLTFSYKYRKSIHHDFLRELMTRLNNQGLRYSFDTTIAFEKETEVGSSSQKTYLYESVHKHVVSKFIDLSFIKTNNKYYNSRIVSEWREEVVEHLLKQEDDPLTEEEKNRIKALKNHGIKVTRKHGKQVEICPLPALGGKQILREKLAKKRAICVEALLSAVTHDSASLSVKLSYDDLKERNFKDKDGIVISDIIKDYRIIPPCHNLCQVMAPAYALWSLISDDRFFESLLEQVERIALQVSPKQLENFLEIIGNILEQGDLSDSKNFSAQASSIFQTHSEKLSNQFNGIFEVVDRKHNQSESSEAGSKSNDIESENIDSLDLSPQNMSNYVL